MKLIDRTEASRTVSEAAPRLVRVADGCWIVGHGIKRFDTGARIFLARAFYAHLYGKTRVRYLTARCGNAACVRPSHHVELNDSIHHPKTKRKFFAKIQKTNDCWHWLGSRTGFGCGMFKVGPRAQLAHRLSYELHKGPIPDGAWVLHFCDNPWCVNPAHLRLGTIKDNAADRVRRGRVGRCAFPKGEHHPFAKLTEDQVREMRAIVEFFDGSLKAGILDYLANQFRVTKSLIRRIVQRSIWRDV